MDLILFISYSLSQGIREAGVFSDGVGEYMKNNHSYDIHKFFVMDRSIVWVTFMLMSFLLLKESPHLLNGEMGGFSFITDKMDPEYVPFFLAFTRGVSFILIFSFFHDGVYNVFRKILDENMPYSYVKSWFYSSKTSTANLNFDFEIRLVMLIIGGVLYYNTI